MQSCLRHATYIYMYIYIYIWYVHVCVCVCVCMYCMYYCAQMCMCVENDLGRCWVSLEQSLARGAQKGYIEEWFGLPRGTYIYMVSNQCFQSSG